jgi:hemolysin activation/secretion protein
VVAEVEAAYPLIRRRRTNLNIAGGFDLVDQKTDVGGGGTLAEDRLRVFYLRADGDYRFVFDERPVTTTGSLSLRRGVTGLGASSAGGALATRALAEPDAWLLRGPAVSTRR